MKLDEIIFDYHDLFYHNENPLLFLTRKEFNETLRNMYYLLDEKERFIIDEIIIQEKSLINTALLLDMKAKEVKNKLDTTLETLYQLFKNAYYDI